MKKFTLFLFLVLISCITGFAQKGVIIGKVTDASTGESLIGVNIVYGKGLGVITDIDGNFKLEIPYGSYTLTVSYVGYVTQSLKVMVGSTPVKTDLSLQNVTLAEVDVVADIARTRETPVAFSTITPRQIEEQLGGRDLPMLLNSTPGVYATQMGGGDGDARITIRGFNARNVGVLLDGVPVNDMENGIVYWSNWFGLDNVTRSVQVQRGLGASKLALPSVGGTINIITKGIDERRGGTVKQEFGSDGYLNTSFGYNSGKLKKGFGYTLAASYKRGDGWVDHTWSKAYFFYGKVDKVIGHHIISVSAYGAPQSHGQRSYNLPAAVYSKKWAMDHGVDSIDLLQYSNTHWPDGKYTFDHGTRYNQHWGQFQTYTIHHFLVPGTQDTTHYGGYDSRSERINEFFKPQFTIKDFWTINSKLSLSNIAYMSLGNGGGVRAKKSPLDYLASGEWDIQPIRDYNTFYPILPGDTANYSATLNKTNGNFLVERKNDHIWLGLLSTFTYSYSPSITMSGGIDVRTYKGKHYEEIYDLIGAGYIINFDDHSQSQYLPNGKLNYKAFMKQVGDKINYYNDGLVRWGGLFYQAEYKVQKLSAFINLTTARTGYQRVDLFKPDSLQKTDWKWINGWTVKGGANYNINRYFSVFMNLGYLNKAPRFNNVFDNYNLLYRDIKNEIVRAVELGLAYSSRKFSINVNSYYTNWLNRPVDLATPIPITDSLGETVTYSANINGLAALHKGIEIDFAWQPLRKVKIEGLFSLGDWIWNSADTVRVRDDYGATKLVKYVDAKGIHVGDAAQFQVGGQIRYEPVKDLYVSGNITYFGKYYSNFDPMSYDKADPKDAANFDANGNPVDPWIIPSYFLVDFNAGYAYRISKAYKIQFRLNVLNALNTVYVSDADDNSANIGQSWNTHDTRSAAVFFGLGRRYTASIAFQF
ncbi:MAG: carboxypeptidase-like regulatory domain-containing protein [Bacteroidetes bacterium]|nr:carboxypeptidase-like regulatory domain-containing protein [Bacteroidota bacterium]